MTPANAATGIPGVDKVTNVRSACKRINKRR
jgi:hypothetical protein